MTSKNPYEVLGVSPTDTETTIKKKYNSLVKKYHPDINKDAGSKEKFNEIYEAYNQIKNGYNSNINNNNNNIDIDTIFKTYNNINIHSVYRTSVNVSFAELQLGCEKIISADSTLLSFIIPPNTSPDKVFNISKNNKSIKVSLNAQQDGYEYTNNKFIKTVKISSYDFHNLNTIDIENHIGKQFNVSLKKGMSSNQMLRIPNAGLYDEPLYLRFKIIKG